MRAEHRFASLHEIEAIAEKRGGHLAELTIVRGDDGASESIRVAFVRGVAKSDLLATMNELRSVVGVLEIRT